MAVLGASLGSHDADGLRAVPSALQRALARSRTHVAELVDAVEAVDRLFVTARGVAIGTASEAALKLLESCGVAAMGVSAPDLMHGPIAAAGEDCPVLVICADRNHPVRDSITAVLDRCHDLAIPWYAIGRSPRRRAPATPAVTGSSLPTWLAPLELAVPVQLLVEMLARRRGTNPDKPSGLTKITQT